MKSWDPGCCGCGPTCPEGYLRLTVRACGNPVPGQVVEILQGLSETLVGTATTDAAGLAILTPPEPIVNPYKWRITRARFLTATSAFFNAVCNTAQTTNLVLAGGTSNVWSCTNCDPVVPQKRTLFLTSGIGPRTLTFGPFNWLSGNFNYTIAGSCDGSSGDTGTISYTLGCQGPGLIRLVTLYSLCGFSNCLFGATSPGSSFTSIASTSGNRTFDVNQPINLSFSWPGDFTHAYADGSVANPLAAGCTYPNFGAITVTE